MLAWHKGSVNPLAAICRAAGADQCDSMKWKVAVDVPLTVTRAS